jgi:flavodoxin
MSSGDSTRRAAIIYRSRTGTTRRFAEEIGAHLKTRGVETSVSSIGDCDPENLGEMDIVLLGCWTNGLFVIHQHPDQPWLDFVRDVPALPGARVGLFTTYRLATGSMFAKMRTPLAGKAPSVGLELKSRDGHLSDEQRRALDRFLAGG